MRAVLQRVTSASVEIDGATTGRIGKGLVILVGVRNGDTKADAEFLAQKCVNLRIFADDQGKFNLSALDVGAELLVVSQFTLYADCRRGRRPGFTDAAPPELSKPLYEHFVAALRGHGLTVAEGVFGAHMVVHINNDGPVTVILDSPVEER
ncbi:MAG: D-aminoacyl-tRNA deacylase [candidate division KSB1 bacterium]|nr:D-aminoacyl-tRNA deacylase [candidate division KSB1 bacterium]MDZ7391310.1 D-aminoacyl-tRNA deacylase [candidate division KSB1 bacterium]